MKTEIKIEGMTCGHCAKSITDEISAIAGVHSVNVNHELGTAIVEAEGVSNQALTEAVAEAGYTAKEFATLNV